MSYQPVIPLSGIAGWRFLERTQEKQEAAFAKDAVVQRDVEYFQEKISSVTSSAELLADRRLLKVALGAFGLDAEIDKKALLRKVLDEGTDVTDSLANRISNRGFRELSAAFGFGNSTGSRTAVSGFADKIVAAYKERAFESAVGDSNSSMEIALSFKRQIGSLVSSDASWYSILGSEDLRAVLDKALGLPDSFAQLDIDKQAAVYADKASRVFGADSIAEIFSDPAKIDKAITRYLARVQIEEGTGDSTSPAAAALQLLNSSSSSSSSSGLMNLIGSLR